MHGRQQELSERLKALKISYSRIDDGYAAVSASEPIFCFVRDTQAELKDLIERTLTSYAKIFYEIDLSVKVIEKPITPLSIPVKKLTPVSNAEPVIGAMACA